MSTSKSSFQANAMLQWFFKQGVSSVDIHLRCPKFKNAKYKSDDWIWLTSHEKLSLDKANSLMKWCRFKNYNGSDIFIRPHRHDKQPVIFLDDLTLDKAMLVSKKYRSLLIETSPNNTQVWVSLEKSISEKDRKLLQEHISTLGFTDKGSISGEHLGRLCGFKSHKRNYWVKYVKESSSKQYEPPILKLSPFPQGGACAKIRHEEGAPSQSEKDFSWVLSEIRKGNCPNKIISFLAASAEARGKPAPMKYATRTVRRAIEILT
jgi:hypothetical protein